MSHYLNIAKQFLNKQNAVTKQDAAGEIRELSEIRSGVTDTATGLTGEIRELSEIRVSVQGSPPDEARIRAWLAHINETDPAMITECLDRCATDPDALAYFLWRSKEVPLTDSDKADAMACGMTDCRDCVRFRGDTRGCSAGRCPIPETLFRRCESFKPTKESCK